MLSNEGIENIFVSKLLRNIQSPDVVHLFEHIRFDDDHFETEIRLHIIRKTKTKTTRLHCSTLELHKRSNLIIVNAKPD